MRPPRSRCASQIDSSTPRPLRARAAAATTARTSTESYPPAPFSTRDGSGKERPRRVRAIGLPVVTRYGRRRRRVPGLWAAPHLRIKKGTEPPAKPLFLRFFEDNDERGLCFAEHGRVASFGAQCGCLGAYDRPCFLRWTPRAGVSMMVESPAKFVGLGVSSWAHKGRAFMYGNG
jgi:hypothetical protein